LAQAKVLICDFSGIIYDFALVHRKPIIVINFEWDDGGFEASDIINEPSTKCLLSDVGKVIAEKEIPEIVNIIEKLSQVEISEQTINKHIYNFRNAGQIAATQILSIKKRY
jgi:CDP-glycerol glycerophosphotransferase (TagB/SpsB family)